MAIDFEAAVKMIKESNGKTFYDVVLPCAKQTVQMRTMSVGMKKTLAKLAMSDSDKDYVQFKMAQVALIKALDIKSEIDIERLKEVDFMSIMAQIIDNNIISPLAVKVPCQQLNCKAVTLAKVDLPGIVKALSDTQKGISFSKEYVKIVGDFEYKFDLNLPNIVDSIVLESLKQESMSEDEYDMAFPYLFIQKVFINGEEVTLKASADSTITGMISLIETLPSKLISGEGSLIEFIQTSYKDYGQILDAASQTVICNECKQPIRGAVNADNFFLF